MEILIYGTVNSIVFALIAVGFTLVYGVSRVPNFAHGSIYVLVGFFTWSLVNDLNLNYALAIFISIAVSAVVGLLIYRVVLIRLRGMATSEIIASFAVSLIILEGLRMQGIAGFKGFMDGSLGSRTAYMREPFADAAPGAKYPRGQLNAMVQPFEKFKEMVIAADAARVQIAVHAIGDEANHLLLDAYEAAEAANPRKNVQHRIEHAQHLLVEDIPRFAKLGVAASMQPFHKADDARYAEKALGKERLRGSYAFRELLDAGATVAFGSDFPVVSMNPWDGIHAAVTARTLTGDVWLPSHSLTLEEALRAYTLGPIQVDRRDALLGTVERSKFADLVILTVDPFDLLAEKLNEVGTWMTIVGGKIVYPRED